MLGIKKIIKYLVLLFIINSCNYNESIDNANKKNIEIDNQNQKILIDSNKKTNIIFDKPSDSLSYYNFYDADYKNALIKSHSTIIHYDRPTDTIKQQEVYTNCVCIRGNEKLTILFSSVERKYNFELFLILKENSAYGFRYYSGDLGNNIYSLQVRNIYISTPIKDTSKYIEGFIKLERRTKNEFSQVIVDINGPFKCGIYPKSKTYDLLPKAIEQLRW